MEILTTKYPVEIIRGMGSKLLSLSKIVVGRENPAEARLEEMGVPEPQQRLAIEAVNSLNQRPVEMRRLFATLLWEVGGELTDEDQYTPVQTQVERTKEIMSAVDFPEVVASSLIEEDMSQRVLLRH